MFQYVTLDLPILLPTKYLIIASYLGKRLGLLRGAKRLRRVLVSSSSSGVDVTATGGSTIGDFDDVTTSEFSVSPTDDSVVTSD